MQKSLLFLVRKTLPQQLVAERNLDGAVSRSSLPKSDWWLCSTICTLNSLWQKYFQVPYRLKATQFEIPVEKRVTKVTNRTIGHKTVPGARLRAPPCSAKPCSCQIYFLTALPPTGLVHDFLLSQYGSVSAAGISPCVLQSYRRHRFSCLGHLHSAS